MTPQEIEALALTGATTIVAAMATDAWTTARNRVAALFHRRNPDLQAQIEAQLDANSAFVAQDQNVDRSRRALIGLWQLELQRLLSADPGAADDLSTQTAEIQSELPAALQEWVQHNTARDHGVVNAVQHGTQHVHYMDSPKARRVVGLAPEETN
ncbi:hypothetical protein OG333_37520 (plasmid) [Streptomyces anulatus]|uniref:hypothetical protein n=1 Tax=Streptomyces anulatus TaxID=1892 RepID=UPI002F90F5C4|nr:hypothetical protein OG333_37520 [Streptomyces anulatus]